MCIGLALNSIAMGRNTYRFTLGEKSKEGLVDDKIKKEHGIREGAPARALHL